MLKYVSTKVICTLTLILLTIAIVAPPSNASKWQMGFNSPFKGLKYGYLTYFSLRQVV